jgi:hypothetical protein
MMVLINHKRKGSILVEVRRQDSRFFSVEENSSLTLRRVSELYIPSELEDRQNTMETGGLAGLGGLQILATLRLH